MDSAKEVEEEVQNLQRFGEFYAKVLLLIPEKETTIRNRLENIKELKVTTTYPLLLRLFEARDTGDLDDVELEKCLGLIEAFVVRRAVCGVPTNALNKLFIQWAKNFPISNHARWLHDSMASGGASRRFPRDAEFAEAFTNQPQYGRGSTRFILCRLEKAYHHKEPVDLSVATIEHVLPQTLNQEWKDELGVEPEKIHAELVDTFGNWTFAKSG